MDINILKELYPTGGSRDMKNNAILSLYGSKKQNTSQTTHRKSSLAVILRSQPTFYNQRVTRYGFWAISGISGPILAQKAGFALLSL